jgi:predicted DNA-binding transcriptional regulator YafY
MIQKRDGRMQIAATVTDSRQLRWWLLGFGHYVEVIRPKSLRDEFAEHCKKMAKSYLS